MCGEREKKKKRKEDRKRKTLRQRERERKRKGGAFERECVKREVGSTMKREREEGSKLKQGFLGFGWWFNYFNACILFCP